VAWGTNALEKAPSAVEDGGAVIVGHVNDSRLLPEIFDECNDCEHQNHQYQSESSVHTVH